jgi:hypothetical protein
MDRPLGVSLLGTASIVLGALGAGVCSFLAFVGLMGICNGAFTTTGGAASTAGLVGLGVNLIGVFATLALAVLGVGILDQRAWAWMAAVCLSALMVLGAAAALIRQAFAPATDPGAVTWSAIAVVLTSAILASLLATSARAAFGLAVETSPALQTRHAA